MQYELEYIAHRKEAPMKCMLVSLENSSFHWHYEYEVFFTLRGSVNIRCETGSFLMKEGDLFLFNPQVIHSIGHTDKQNLCLILQFSPSLLSEIYGTSFLFSLNTADNQPMNAQTINILRSILAEMGLLLFNEKDGYQCFLKGWLFHFIGTLFEKVQYSIISPQKIENTNAQLEEFDLVKRYIKEHFRENLSQQQLCHQLGMSRTKIYNLFRDANAGSSTDMIAHYRVEYAKNLLRSTKTPIAIIVTDCGFDSEPSFFRTFKKITGQTPNQYRKIPEQMFVPTGIQGYADYARPEAIDLMNDYLLRNVSCVTTNRGDG